MSISYAVFCLNTTPTATFSTLSLHDALPIFSKRRGGEAYIRPIVDRDARRIDFEVIEAAGTPPAPSKNRCLFSDTPLSFAYIREEGVAERLRSEEHTSELQSHVNLVCRLLLEYNTHSHVLHSFPTRRSSDLQ